MKIENVDRLVERYHAGECTKAEAQVLKAWLHNYNMEGSTGLSDHDFEEARRLMLAKIQSARPVKLKTHRLWRRVVAVAAAVAVIVSGVYWFHYNGRIIKESADLVANDVAPGKVGATLTLASGRKIRLIDAANGELANKSGISIIKTADGQLVYQVKDDAIEPGETNTLSTAKGETFMVTLPDKSRIWLNAASSLTFNTGLMERESGKRSVKLTGEAYFQVAKDKSHPFVVKTNSQNVEVLGTHFNVSTYMNEPIVTTLEEGAIKVTTATSSKLIVPGQSAINDGTSLQVERANLDKVLAWKNGNFVFSGDGIQEVMRKLERWYDIEVVFEGKLTGEVFYGDISRYKHISQVLKMLEKTRAVHFSIKGRRVTVME